MSERPTHQCSGSFQLLSKGTGKYRVQMTDCPRQCQQDGVNLNYRVCLACIELKPKPEQTSRPPPFHTPDSPEPIPQLAPGSGSQLIENIEVLDEKGIWIKARALHDSGADLTAVDTDFTDGLGTRPLVSSRDFSVSTIHGTSGIASEYTLTIRMQGAPRTAKFLGVAKMAKLYPGHRLQLQEKLLRMYGLKEEHLYQETGIVNLLIGSNRSSLFPTTLYQQDNVIIARSKFTGKLLVQGAAKLPNLANHHLAAQTLRLCGLKFHESPATDPYVTPPRTHQRR